MNITQGLAWGACSTLMFHGLSDIEFVEHGKPRFAQRLLEELQYVSSQKHYEDYKELCEKYNKNKIPNLTVFPANYIKPCYQAGQYAWLICSTNSQQHFQQKWLQELGFYGTPESYNTKNETYVTLFFIHPDDAIKNCKKYLESLKETK